MSWTAEDIISGERLQSLAEMSVFTQSVLAFHRSVRQAGVRDGVIFPGSHTEIDPHPMAVAKLKGARSIFVYTHLLDSFVRKVLPQLSHRFVLITHNSDDGIDQRYRTLLDDERIAHHFAQNALIVHPKLTPLPIGIGNAQWPHGDAAALARAANAVPQERRAVVYCNFEVATNPGVRGPLKQRLAAAEGVWHAPSRPFGEYLSDMAGCRWCISPPGNGIDCHRTWEALYLGVIPILQRSEAGAVLHDGLPVLQLDDLGAVTAAGAAAVPVPGGPLDRIRLSWWRARIAEAVASI